MKFLHPVPLLAIATLLCGAACKKPLKPVPPAAPSRAAAASEDIPLLPAKKGDFWRYQVHLEIPADVTQNGTPEAKKDFQQTRTYLGKIPPSADLPETDCFEVITPGFPAEREFVEIHESRILLRGTRIMRPEITKPQWYDQPIPFLEAGVKAGDELREFQVGSPSRTRKIQIIGREEITVPAGTYPTIRLLMSGVDGPFELRRTIWFSPGCGIIREEKIRYHQEKLILRESLELLETSMKKR